jgi:hypothetical protein
MRTEILAPIVTGIVMIIVVAIRSATGGRVQIKLNDDAVIAAIAAGLTLLMSGFITKLGVTTTGVTIETARDAILQASAKPVSQQVSPLPLVPFGEVAKGGAAEIPSVIQRRVQGLDFRRGKDSYVADVVIEYLKALTQHQDRDLSSKTLLRC